MAVAIVGILGQSKPGATTVTDIYTVPATRRARVVILWTNQSASTADEVSVWLSEDGAAAADSQKIKHLETVAAKSSGSTMSLLLSDTDVIRVESQNGDVSFTVNGYEDDKPT